MDATDLITDEPGHVNGQPPPAEPAPEPAAARFARLKAEWDERTKYLSNPDKITSDPAYQEVIRMGWDVVPLILADIRRGRYLWHAALCDITGEDPTPDDAPGNYRRFADAWLEWGRARGY